MGSWCWERYFGGGGPTGRGDSSQGAPCSFGVREGGGLGSSTVTCCWLPPLKRRNPHEVGCWSGFRPRYNSARAIRLRRMTSGGADLCSPMQHPSSMAFYRARPSADTLKQDELHAAAGQCSERWRRPRVVRWWMRQPWRGFAGVPCPLHGAFAVSSGESGPTQSTWVHRSLPSSSSLDREKAVL